MPVYSVFRGKIGAVDQYLASRGRLVLLESVEDIHTKIVVARRARPEKPSELANTILNRVVDEIIELLEKKQPSRSYGKIALNQFASAVGKRGSEFNSSEPTK